MGQISTSDWPVGFGEEMAGSKPETLADYKTWLQKMYNVESTSLNRTYYESVSNKILIEFMKSDFWQAVPAELERLDQKYFITEDYHHFTANFRPDMKLKPFSSFLEKTFRKNIVENENWPNEPKGGWILPESWYSEIGDIVRTMFVVKYLDGVSFFVANFSDLLSKHDMPVTVDYEAREEGYYAAHLSTEYECEIPKESWDTKRVRVKIEMQVTTQLQEVIKNLLHKYYEGRRLTTKASEVKWQWDYRSEEFATNYLGHILHYVEGMIMDIRQKQRGAKQ
jgi:hypothetical protein